jgi:hypothetical protein
LESLRIKAIPEGSLRPGQVCEALLAALDASEGRRRRRKRDTRPDAIGLAIKRRILEQASREDPDPENFEQWLLQREVLIDGTPAPGGAVAAMARDVFDEWRMARAQGNFRSWLERGAPSDDAAEPNQRGRPGNES